MAARESEAPERAAAPGESRWADRTGRARAVLGARIAGGVIALGVAGVVVGASTLLPLPTLGHTPTGEQITPVASGEIRVCPGALLSLGDEANDATTARPLGGLSVAAHGALEQQPLADDASAGALLFTSTSDVDPATVSVAQSQQPNGAASPGLAGLAATACAAPNNDAWLVGGDTTVGRSGILMLANPFEVAATVNLTMWGSRGQVNAPGATGITVPPLTQRALPLAGFAPGEPSLVIRVESRGGTIAANVQHAVQRGLEAGGVDLVGAGAAPSTRQVIPGITIRDSVATLQRTVAPGYSDLLPIARLLAPGDTATTARIGLVPVAAGGAGTSMTVELEPGVVSDVMIDGLADGDYVMVVESDDAVVAGARVATAAGSGGPDGADGPDAGAPSGQAAGAVSDFMWAGSTPALGGPAQFSVAPGASASLHLSNPGDAAVTVSLTNAARPDGGAQTVEVPAGGAVVVPVAASGAYQVEGRGVRAAVALAGRNALATYPVVSPRPLAEPVTVFVR